MKFIKNIKIENGLADIFEDEDGQWVIDIIDGASLTYSDLLELIKIYRVDDD